MKESIDYRKEMYVKTMISQFELGKSPDIADYYAKEAVKKFDKMFPLQEQPEKPVNSNSTYPPVVLLNEENKSLNKSHNSEN